MGFSVGNDLALWGLGYLGCSFEVEGVIGTPYPNDYFYYLLLLLTWGRMLGIQAIAAVGGRFNLLVSNSGHFLQVCINFKFSFGFCASLNFVFRVLHSLDPSKSISAV